MVRDKSGEEYERQRQEADDPLRCTWRTDGRQCYMTRGFMVGREMYCHWHYVTKDNPRARDSFDDFESWQNHWKGYCSEENHWTNAEVWEAIQGNKDLLLVNRHRCDAALCRKVG